MASRRAWPACGRRRLVLRALRSIDRFGRAQGPWGGVECRRSGRTRDLGLGGRRRCCPTSHVMATPTLADADGVVVDGPHARETLARTVYRGLRDGGRCARMLPRPNGD